MSNLQEGARYNPAPPPPPPPPNHKTKKIEYNNTYDLVLALYEQGVIEEKEADIMRERIKKQSIKNKDKHAKIMLEIGRELETNIQYHKARTLESGISSVQVSALVKMLIDKEVLK